MTRYSLQEKNNMSSTKYAMDYMDVAITYIKFIGDYNKFDEWK